MCANFFAESFIKEELITIINKWKQNKIFSLINWKNKDDTQMISSIASDNKIPTRSSRVKYVQPRPKPRVYIKPLRSSELIHGDPQHRSLHSLATLNDQISLDKEKSLQSIPEMAKLPFLKRMQVCVVGTIHKIVEGFRSVTGSFWLKSV